MDKYSVVITTPAANLAASSQLAELLGYSANEFGTPLSATESGPATHYGLHTYARQDFVDMLSAAQGGTMPAVEGMTPVEVAAIVGQWTVSIEPGDVRLPVDHFNEAILPLARVE